MKLGTRVPIAPNDFGSQVKSMEIVNLWLIVLCFFKLRCGLVSLSSFTDFLDRSTAWVRIDSLVNLKLSSSYYKS